MEISYDNNKNHSNKEKHGVPLKLGASVLSDPNRITVLDVRFTYNEDRFVCYGKVNNRVWVCVFTEREDTIRVISVRKANSREVRRYEQEPR